MLGSVSQPKWCLKNPKRNVSREVCPTMVADPTFRRAMKFLFLRKFALRWKKRVFASPTLNQFTLERCFHFISSRKQISSYLIFSLARSEISNGSNCLNSSAPSSQSIQRRQCSVPDFWYINNENKNGMKYYFIELREMKNDLEVNWAQIGVKIVDP